MKANRLLLQERLEGYESQLQGLHSYVTELKAMTAKHATDKEMFATDLIEAQHNIRYYQNGIALLKTELSNAHRDAPTQADLDNGPATGGPPRLIAVVISSLSFLVGAVVGSRLKSRKQ
jgi:hypothetical protein